MIRFTRGIKKMKYPNLSRVGAQKLLDAMGMMIAWEREESGEGNSGEFSSSKAIAEIAKELPKSRADFAKTFLEVTGWRISFDEENSKWTVQ